MKSGAVPWYGVTVLAVYGLVWLWLSYGKHEWAGDADDLPNRPQIEAGSNRFGRYVEALDMSDLEPGMLVLFKTRRTRGEEKETARIVALEGQRVRMENDKVFVDDEEFADPYERSQRKVEYLPELVVPAGCVFVLADMRAHSASDRRDSRCFGPIPLRSILMRFSPKEKKTGGGRRR